MANKPNFPKYNDSHHYPLSSPCSWSQSATALFSWLFSRQASDTPRPKEWQNWKETLRFRIVGVPNEQFNLYCSEPIQLEASIVITLSSWTTPIVFGCFLSAHLPIRWNALGHTGVSGFLLLWYVEELFGRIRRKKRKISLVVGIARLLWRLNLIIWPKMSHRATSTKPFLTGTGVFEDQEATHWLPALKFMPPTSLLDDSM